MTRGDLDNAQVMSSIIPVIVIDYIDMPFQSEDSVLAYTQHLKDTTGFVLPDADSRLQNIPRGSIIGLPINNNTTSAIVLYPFFSHIKMPVKAGEVVWALNNHPIGYWLTRKTSDRIADDPNFTHSSRAVNSFLKDDGERSRKIQQSFNRLPNQIVDYQKVFDESLSNKASFQGESTPRFFTAEPDMSLEGSNNSLVVLGSASTLGQKQAKAGMIDIVVGRGQTPTTGPSSVFSNSRKFLENDKTAPLNMNEGKIDLLNDLSSVYVSMNDNLDSQFNIAIGNASAPGPSAGIRSNHIRISARDDVKITSESQSNHNGIIVNKSNVIITSGAESNATDVIIDSIGFQANLAAAFSEISALFKGLGLPTPSIDILISQLQLKSFSSKITKSE